MKKISMSKGAEKAIKKDLDIRYGKDHKLEMQNKMIQIYGSFVEVYPEYVDEQEFRRNTWGKYIYRMEKRLSERPHQCGGSGAERRNGEFMIASERNLQMETNCQNLTDISEQVIKDNGYMTTTYPVFPGIEFAFVDAHCQQIVDERKGQAGDMLEIIYCREGRSEFKLNDEFVFLSAGDLMIVKANTVSPVMNFPLKHYHGLTICIDLDKTPHCLSCFLEDVNVQPWALADRFCGGDIGYITRANQAIEHIFSEIYSVSEHIRKGYCKIKTLELLLFLSQLHIENDTLQGRLYSRTQVLLAEKIAKYLYEHMDDRITLEQLSALFHISVAYIKNTFKHVYGVPVGAYIRTIKMESAAYMLEYTDKTILEIATEHGYDNGSKFAAAFRAVKGMNPARYRNEIHIKPKTIQMEPFSAL